MNKSIPAKNYIILLILIIITVIAVFYAQSWYNTTRAYNSEDSIMLTVVNEINPDELSNYVLENPKFVLYTASKQNEELKPFENQLKNIIVKNNIEDLIIYINIDNVDKKSFSNQLQSYLQTPKANININDNASMYFFDGGKITHVINNANEQNINQITKLLKKDGMIDNG